MESRSSGKGGRGFRFSRAKVLFFVRSNKCDRHLAPHFLPVFDVEAALRSGLGAAEEIEAAHNGGVGRGGRLGLPEQGQAGEGAIAQMGGIDDAPRATVDEQHGQMHVPERSDAAREVAVGENKATWHVAPERRGNTAHQPVGVGVDFARHIIKIHACARRAGGPDVERTGGRHVDFAESVVIASSTT